MTLVEALKKFNRKERYWLIRNALGKNSKKLDSKFRKSLEEKLSIPVREDAWWAMDYHLDWLVGALHLFNPKGEGTEYEERPKSNQELVHGTQEDVDLIIAFDKTLIFIEAKGDAGWDYEQLKSKIKRVEGIKDKEYFEGIQTYFFLMTLEAMQEIQMEKIGATRPDWIFPGGEPRWLDLQIEDEHDQKVTSFEGFCRVGRCKENMTSCKPGKSFLVKNRRVPQV